MAPTKQELIDLGWRSGWTFVQAFIGGLLAAPIFGVEALDAAGIAAFAATLSVVKSYAGLKLNKDAARGTGRRMGAGS